ncbi:MAG: heme-binding domain-containing protein [Campylobacterota bacterium]|nr:heme-binding domain-containing protein [Campylobacterota bacterium]
MKKILIITAIVIVAIQFIPVSETNPLVDEKLALHPPLHVEQILQHACNDCHSNSTQWPAYSKIAPISLFVASHVNSGRKAINFSEFANMPKERKIKRLKRAISLIKNGMMPLASYTLMHKEADLTLEQKKSLIEYFESELSASATH